MIAIFFLEFYFLGRERVFFLFFVTVIVLFFFFFFSYSLFWSKSCFLYFFFFVNCDLWLSRPGLLPNWKRLSPNNGLENCRRAMLIAERLTSICLIKSPRSECFLTWTIRSKEKCSVEILQIHIFILIGSVTWLVARLYDRLVGRS